MHQLAAHRGLSRLLPFALDLLLVAALLCGASTASAQILQPGDNSNGQSWGSDNQNSSGTGVTRNGFGARTSPDNGTGAGGIPNLSGGVNGLSQAGTVNALRLQQAGALQNPNGLNGVVPAPGYVPYVPGEFELYVNSLAPTLNVRRLGADLMQPGPSSPQSLSMLPSQQLQPSVVTDTSSLVPPDYLIAPGDELDVTLSGSIDAQVQLFVDRTGRISLPRVGSVMVSGVRYEDLPELLTRQVARQFRNFKLSVSLGQLRGMRVYVTGFVPRPGAYAISSLTTVSAALINAGGPTAAGSFRNIDVRRRGALVATFDLYDLIITGKRDADIVLQADDVVHVGPVGPEVAVLGSVNQPAIVELKKGDDLAAVLRMAGGLSSVADASRITIEPLNDRTQDRVIKVSLADGSSRQLDRGDVVNVYSAVDVRQPTVRQNKRIIVEGEVARPGVFVLPATATIADALAQAGGMTANGYLYGTQFTRESVRQTQQANYNKLLQNLEIDMEQSITTQVVSSADEAKAQDSRSASASRLVSELRKIQPSGRMVVLTDPAARSLPPMQIEDGDRLYIPTTPTSVGVFGSVFTAGSFLFSDSQRIGDYLRMAGGPKRGADKDSEFVLRANGTVVSDLQESGWFHKGNLKELNALPGDTIFVPEELNKMSGLEVSKSWTQILYQFGLGVAGISAAIR